ncbi:Pre-mRNA-processing protein 40A [Acorus gramineus]|uniref:Pre-mRNA-processing protein 40A n=1 Tax=Acorus gramineus TaxID=55184 RepID=A0AAV9B4S0_ACOGR|nr:Pre-mRNA-processing protein 40A [Acorus gramineus]
MMGNAGPTQNYGQPMPMQPFRPVIPMQQSQQFIPAPSQQFRPIGQVVPPSNVGIPSAQPQMPPFPQSGQQVPQRSGPPASQGIPMPYIQPNMPMASGPMQMQQSTHFPISSSYTFAPPSYGQPQSSLHSATQYQPVSQIHAPVVHPGGQPWSSGVAQGSPLVTPVPQSSQSSNASTLPVLTSQSISTQVSHSDWQEHTSDDGKRYYYNKKTRQSSWEKPVELMTPIEHSGEFWLGKVKKRADASTVWKEFTTAEGRKYYYNKLTKQSKWVIPDELKLAREQAENSVAHRTESDNAATSLTSAVPTSSTTEMTTPSATTTSSTLGLAPGVVSSPILVTPIVNAVNPSHTVVSVSPSAAAGSSTVAQSNSPKTSNLAGLSSINASVSPVEALSAAVSSAAGVASVAMDATTTTTMSKFENASLPSDGVVADGASTQDIEEAKKGMPVAGKVNITPLEEKVADEEPLIYANKMEAKNAFKALLESANVESDWNWEQYLGQRKKQEAEEKRIKQKKAREDFTKMLEESRELTSTMRWSKAISLFEDDERFKAVDRPRDREDLFESYLSELQKKERAKAVEEHKRHIMEYRAFLESCDFIKASSQWRKVQDRLEDDERCSRLEKIDRLEIFQEYIRDLEKEEEEQRKIQKEQIRRAERKNRDEFRKLMEEHVSAGILTAKTHWREYCMKVKDLPPYQAVSSNTSGSTPKDLFEDVAEELERQYYDDKTRLKDALKMTKEAIPEDESLKSISEVNLKFLKKTMRVGVTSELKPILCNAKDGQTGLVSSKWEDCKTLFEDSQEYRAIAEENFKKEIFEEYIIHLQEKLKEKERKRDEEKAKKEKERGEKEKRKEKDRKEKEREREKEKGKERSRKDEIETDNNDAADSHGLKDERKREKEKDRKHRKRHHNTADDISSEKEEKEDTKRSRRHSSDQKKSRKHGYTTESDSENRHKRHKRDRDGPRRNGNYEELEDGELGEDGEIGAAKQQILLSQDAFKLFSDFKKHGRIPA